MVIEEKLNEKQGHWILAKAGKRVLRPGGRALTKKLIANLNITPQDDVVEFAPGMGFTARLACARNPRSYTGVDRNKQASDLARKSLDYDKVTMIVADASDTTLPSGYASKVYGEAMLTMQPMAHKQEIVREAVRILRPGGYYGIHELGLYPDEIAEGAKESVYKDLSANIRVHARPLTTDQWCQLLTNAGLEVIKVETNPMALLEFGRVLNDEGIFRTLKIFFNILSRKDMRNRVIQMRRTFRKHKKNMNAVAIVARKIG